MRIFGKLFSAESGSSHSLLYGTHGIMRVKHTDAEYEVIFMQPMIERLYEAFQPVVEGLGLSLVDVEWAPARGGRRLGVYIARKKGGVSFDDCALVSRALETTLEEEPELDSSYTLEVSSPGLERVLKRPAEYDIFVGRAVALILHGPGPGLTTLEGLIEGFDGTEVSLRIADETMSIPLKCIKKAKLVFKFK